MSFHKRDFSANQVRQYYNRIAWTYDIWRKFTESEAEESSLKLSDVHDGESILEVAVGTGCFFEQVLRLNPTGTNIAIDLTPAMLSKAARRLAEQKLDNYHLQIGSAYALSFRSDSFDLLINNYMFDLLPEEDFPEILSEFKRVLKPWGKLIISSMTFGSRWYNRFWNWLAGISPSIMAGCRAIAIGDYLRAAGFDVVDVEIISQNTFPTEVVKGIKTRGTD